jgi:N-acetylmuramoyl-L-alanine amidase
VISRRLLLGSGVNAAMFANAAAFAATAPQPHPPQSRPPQAPRNLPLVMLDPGHGGKDPGAIGYTGTYEKHVALATALELQRQLRASGRYRVELTRTDDVFIPLEQRVAIAQAKGGALFVSMHADALTNPTVRGASVYTLAENASDAQTEALAKRENSADRFGGPAFQNQPPEVARILASLVRQETRAGSARMARGVVGAFGSDVPLLQNPERHASFVVLKAADIPSVLVEMGFMSNPQDEAELRRPEHQTRVATAMKRAVDAFFSQSYTARMAG